MRKFISDWWPDIRFALVLCGGSCLVGLGIGCAIASLTPEGRAFVIAALGLAALAGLVAKLHHDARKGGERIEELWREWEEGHHD